MTFEQYDIVVVGAGHAGAEAAAAAARLGAKVLLITQMLDAICQMSCNPAMGGVAKGQIVREVDALGGWSGIVTDRSAIQFRMLNLSKGPAMWSPRAQCDRMLFSQNWRRVLESIPNLALWQDEVVALKVEGGAVAGVVTRMGHEVLAKAVVLTSGTFLNGRIFIGEDSWQGGRVGESPAVGLSDQLRELGFEVQRLKTGTPVRVDGRTIDFSRLTPQPGDEHPSKFSFADTMALSEQRPCYIANTNLRTHDILRTGFSRSPMFTGRIQGRGPRYCPSIEDKIDRFADKDHHQLFVEPEGWHSQSYYLNGFSSSLPLEVQLEALHSIEGFGQARIFKPGYAIEYDYLLPTQLHHTLETKLVAGLFFAGQINGTTGYEEAAAQGLMAGINAHHKLKNLEPVVLRRDEAYIGVLIDDLVTKGVDEPYRMFTSRAEYRILLRQDNADLRLTPKGYELGLISEKRWQQFTEKKSAVESLKKFARELSIKPGDVENYLISHNSDPLTQGCKLQNLLLRTFSSFENLRTTLPKLEKFLAENNFSEEVIEQAEIQIKYKGYIEREKLIAEKLRRLENIRIPADFDFHSLQALTIEARQKLTRIRPATIGQASRIPGVSPADVNVMLVKFGR